jgi:hypothetical protein
VQEEEKEEINCPITDMKICRECIEYEECYAESKRDK